MTGRAAVFVDKDGTLVENVPYNVDPAKVRLLPGVAQGLARLQRAGFALFVASNQAGVALGRFPAEALPPLERCLDALLARAGVAIEAYLWCTHHPAGRVAAHAVACACRKPQPGLLLAAARRHGLDLARSWMLGDILDDVEAGRRAGCRAVLVDRGGETEWKRGPLRAPDAIVHRFDAAASFVIAAAQREPRGASCQAA